MIKTLVVHIGDPKNGSSSIQKAMQMGACHPEGVSIVSQPELNASALANAIDPKRGEASRRGSRRQELYSAKADWARDKDADIGIISAEFFGAVPPTALRKALVEFMPQYADTVRIIAYARPHAARAVSGYAQLVKSGASVIGFDETIRGLADRRRLKYAPRFQRWRNVYGDRFVLRPFMRSEMRDGDVVSDFFATVLEDRPFTLDELPSTNESLSLEEVAAMRCVQGRFIAAEVPEFIRLSLGGAIGRALSARPQRLRTRLTLDRANAERLHAACIGDAGDMDREFFHRPLMVPELEAAADKALPEAQSLEAGDYFTADSLQRMEQISDRIAALVKTNPKAWRFEYQRGIGQRLDSITDQPQPKLARKNADQVWALLDQLTAEMAPETAAAGE